jgi:hypothetical protein
VPQRPDEQPPRATHIEHSAVAAQDRRQYLSVTREPAHDVDRKRLAGVRRRRADLAAQVLPIDCHCQLRGSTARHRQQLGGQRVAAQLGERVRAPLAGTS